MDPLRRHLRLSLPFTILTGPDTVRLVAGEDFRYTLTAPGVESWLPRFLTQLDGRRPLADLIQQLDPGQRDSAGMLLERLYGERVIIEATACERHAPMQVPLAVEGTGALADGLRAASQAMPDAPQHLVVFCQDRLDYEALLQFNRRCRADRDPALWASTGPMQRGYVGPVIVPDAGPCLACLVRQFQRLSPAPEIYDHLIEHARDERPIEPAPFPAEGVEVLKQLVLWKRSLLAETEPPAALYRLHVLEIATLEVSAHRVFADPECPECGAAG
jgi:bacteriocin biosynthesis cyclodehydratase domain-containing protein